MKTIYTLLLLSGCVIELKPSESETSYESEYLTGEPPYYEWYCDNDYYRNEAWVDIEAIDCDAFKITARVETYNYDVYQEDLFYDGSCDWYTYVNMWNYSCSEIYDVRLKSYY